MMCEGCTAEEHWRCGMQTWCECECDGSPDWALFDPESDECERVDEMRTFHGKNQYD